MCANDTLQRNIHSTCDNTETPYNSVVHNLSTFTPQTLRCGCQYKHTLQLRSPAFQAHQTTYNSHYTFPHRLQAAPVSQGAFRWHTAVARHVRPWSCLSGLALVSGTELTKMLFDLFVCNNGPRILQFSFLHSLAVRKTRLSVYFLHLAPMDVMYNVPTPENQYGSAAHRCFSPFPFLSAGSSYLRAFTPSLMTSCGWVAIMRCETSSAI